MVLAKSVAVVAFVYACVVVVQFSAEVAVRKLPENCVNDYGDKYDTIVSNLTDDDEVDNEYACFFVCVYKNWSYVDGDGDTRVERFKKYDVNEYDLMQIDTCAKNYEGMDVCERSYRTQLCVERYFKSFR